MGSTGVAGNGEIRARKACSAEISGRARTAGFPMSTMPAYVCDSRAHTADRYPDNPLSRFAMYNVYGRVRARRRSTRHEIIERSDALVNFARDRRTECKRAREE